MKTFRVKVGKCHTCVHAAHNGGCYPHKLCPSCSMHKPTIGQVHDCLCIQETELDYCEYYEKDTNEENR